MSQVREVEITTTLKDDSNIEVKCENQELSNNQVDAYMVDNNISINATASPDTIKSQDEKVNNNNDTTNSDNNTATTANTTNKKRTRGVRKRIPIYQTEDLIREISPQPPSLEEIKNNNGENESNINNSNNDNTGVSVIVKAPETSLLNGKRTVQCNICKRQMTESKLANHIRLLHVDKPEEETIDNSNDNDPKRKKLRCEYCGKLYGTKYTYQQHIKTHTEGRPKCPECGSTFASAFSLFRHRAKNHNLEHNYQTYSCDQCDKSFFSISELKLHQQRHSSKKEFKCEECNKAFSVKGNLRIHMRTHAKEKLYKCDICENTFSHPYSLVSHRRIHTNDFPFKCPECDKGKFFLSRLVAI